MRLRLGTRRSALATTQSGWVADLLRRLGHDVELVEILTEGDVSSAPLTQIGGTGVFAARLRRALLDGEVDLAVHSLKDLPTQVHPGLLLGAIPPREDPRDVLVTGSGRTLAELPPGARIATGSPRRAAQLLALGLGLDPVPIRGNVDTRLGLLRAAAAEPGTASGPASSGAGSARSAARQPLVDGVILARAGLARLGRLDVVTETLEPGQMMPAAGQGALAIEVRADDAAVQRAVAALDDADTRAAVTAERALLATLEAGCVAPIGAFAEVVEGEDGPVLSLRAVVAAADGSDVLRRSLVAPRDDALGAGRRLAHLLFEDGAAQLLGRPASAGPSASGADPTDEGAIPE